MTSRQAKPSSAEPIRFKISYRNPEMLLGEFTRSVGRGSVSIESKRAVPVGTVGGRMASTRCPQARSRAAASSAAEGEPRTHGTIGP